MSAWRVPVVSLVVTVLITCGSLAAEEKKADITSEKLVGSWEAVKVDEKTVPVGSIVEFGKDGKMKITVKEEGKDMDRAGTWAVTGDTLTVNLKLDDREIKHEFTIKKLTATEFVVASDVGKSVEFKRKK